MTYHVAGLDLSTRHTGIAVLRGDTDMPLLRTVLSSPISSGTRPSGAKEAGKSYATLLDRRNRMQQIAARVIAAAMLGWEEGDDPPLFVIESRVAAIETGSIDLDGLWWYCVTLLFKRGIVVEASPGTVKKYATGNGAAKKDAMLAVMPRLFPQVIITDHNLADALALAGMGARALGFPREPSPQRVNPAALDAVDWPRNLKGSTPT